MKKFKAAALLLTAAALAGISMCNPVYADKYNDQKSARELTAQAEADIATERARERAEIKRDVGLSCEQIAHEVVELDRVIRDARDTQVSSSNTGTGVSVARTVGSLLVGSLGGVVGIVAVGALAGEAVESKGEKAAEIEENAEERQHRLAGIFEGKGCEGELALTGEPEHDPAHKAARVEPAAGTSTIKKPRYNE